MFKSRIESLTILTIVAVAMLASGNGHGMSVSGVILDGNDAPVQGRCVALLSNDIDPEAPPDTDALLDSFSDEEGCFIFADISEGSYDVIVMAALLGQSNAPVYAPTTVDLISDSVTNLVIRPTVIARFNLNGELLLAATQQPVDASIKLIPVDPSRAATEISANPHLYDPIETDEAGLFSKSDMASGRYSITIASIAVSFPTVGQFSFEVTIETDGEVIIDAYGQAVLLENDILLNLQAASGL